MNSHGKHSLITRICFWFALVPIIRRYLRGRWYVFSNAPDWMVDIAAAKANPRADNDNLWREAAKEQELRNNNRRGQLTQYQSGAPSEGGPPNRFPTGNDFKAE